MNWLLRCFVLCNVRRRNRRTRVRRPTPANKLTLDGLLVNALADIPEQNPVMTHRTVVSACTLYLVFKEPDFRLYPRPLARRSPAHSAPTARRIGRL